MFFNLFFIIIFQLKFSKPFIYRFYVVAKTLRIVYIHIFYIIIENTIATQPRIFFLEPHI